MVLSDKRKKNKVAILVGGPSNEHKVSLESGQNVLENLPKDYEGKKILIDKNGNWEIPISGLKGEFGVIFIAMHGAFGEDGTIQRLLEEQKISYTGSSPLVSALGMNKFLSLQVFKSAGLNVPPTILVHKYLWTTQKEKILRDITLFLKKPWVVKPNMSGSSLGVKIVNDEENLKAVLDLSFSEFREILVEELIEGRELTCGVLDIGDPHTAFPLLPTEIIPKGRSFFDYESKYNAENHIEITPARIPLPFLNEARKIALYTHKLIGARHFSRTDMILGKDKKIYVLEINTIPGLTKNSLLPQEAEAYGLPFAKVLDMILKSI